MNPNNLSPSIRKKVTEAILALNKIKKSEEGKYFESNKELEEFLYSYYEDVKTEIECGFNDFLEMCLLENKYGFVSGYIAGGLICQDSSDIEIDIEAVNEQKKANKFWQKFNLANYKFNIFKK
jgi:hypothetical protein